MTQINVPPQLQPDDPGRGAQLGQDFAVLLVRVGVVHDAAAGAHGDPAVPQHHAADGQEEAGVLGAEGADGTRVQAARVDSSSSMICIARTFGAPAMVPPESSPGSAHPATGPARAPRPRPRSCA